MKVVVFLLGFLLMVSLAMAVPVYEKVSDTEFKETEEITEIKETIYSIEELLNDKARLLSEIKSFKEDTAEKLKEMEAELAKIEALILKAEKLGIVGY